MPSHLRLQSSLDQPIAAHATYNTTPISPRPAKKARMSLTQTYYVASAARSKLGKEASRADHNLRLLVGHANLLDHLMVELADAERESENWLNQSIREASRPEEPRRVQWMDSIAETYEEDDESDDESESFNHATLLASAPKIKAAPVLIEDYSDDEESDAEYDEDEEVAELSLRRVQSQSLSSPPELTLDSDSESEEDDDEAYGPKSPKDLTIPLSEKEREALSTTAYFDIKSQQQSSAGVEEDYVLRQAQQQPLIAAC